MKASRLFVTLRRRTPREYLSCHRTHSSTGISYLDTWMGNQKRRPVAPAAAVASSAHHVKNFAPNTMDSSSSIANVPSQQNHPAVSSFQLYHLRPDRNTCPQTVIEIFKKSLPTMKNTTVSTSVPIVLDMAAFHPHGSPHYNPPARETLKTFVNAIRSSQNLSVAGVTNLPPPESNGCLSPMEIEAQSLHLPVLQATSIASSVSEIKSSENSLSPSRKKRGGVAPLLRPNRMNNSSVAVAATELTQTSESHPSTKVHKGSVRSGQLITTDYPNQALVIIGSINPGGEVWSEGDVFVLGKLRGRVLAGLRKVGESKMKERPLGHLGESDSSNNETRGESKPKTNSKIFATNFDPELICIGETFTTIDDVSKFGLGGIGPAIVTLDDETEELTFEQFQL